MIIAATCLGLGIASFCLLAYALISRSEVAGDFGFRAGRNEISGNGIGILLAGTFGFLALAIGTWPDSDASLQGSDTAAGTATATPTESLSPSQGPASSSPTAPAEVGPSSAPTADPRRGEAAAANFIAAYESAASAIFSEDQLSEWFTLPVDFYREKGLADRTRLVDLLTPRKPSAERTRYEPAQVMGFRPGDASDVVFARVDYTRPTGEAGSVDVKFVLVPSGTGQPYRISAVSEI